MINDFYITKGVCWCRLSNGSPRNCRVRWACQALDYRRPPPTQWRWNFDSMTGAWQELEARTANGRMMTEAEKKYLKNENIKKHWKKLHLFLHLSQWTLINSMVSLGKACQLQQDFVYEWQVAVCLMYPEVHDWKVAILKMCSLRPFIWHTVSYTKPVFLTIFRPAVLDSPRNLTIFIGMCFPFRNGSSARNQ